ncbi:unnamed protein product [Rotaria socialis]|uniref:Uncharacterized protein n=1 Tax=Rotaria socialis TaxID=392032 RepID=A0A820PCY9_9BILA|nr:unnamed protein product [Rotaria socialis]CAF3410883.1 unnamed protein product [Rotaria socialis]CAF4401680.1 unnamed protein product [Rotaria socialis]CAF4476956.1 unnamed protein product [Rotaria socialis]
MSTPEERRQRIIANGELRLARLREINRGETPVESPPLLPVSSEAPDELLKRPQNQLNTPSVSPANRDQPKQASLFSMITSGINFINSLSAGSPTTSTTKIENTKEMVTIDKQHVLVIILGMIVSLLYSFYISAQSNFFFIVYFTCCICILTSRYYMMEMKHRTNVLITTAMLSGFKPELMKKISLLYTLVYDAWIMFALYFVSFCLTHVIYSLF